LVDTRKVYLDALAQHYHTKEKKKAGELKQGVIRTLDVMSEEFTRVWTPELLTHVNGNRLVAVQSARN
jgi:hypothetical protein